MSLFSNVSTFTRRERDELASLSSERDPEMYREGLIHFGQRLEDRGQMEAAAEVYSALLENPAGTGSEEISQRAQRRLDVLGGQGHMGWRAEILLRNFTRTAADSRQVVPMVAGSVLYRLVMAGSLSRLTAASRAAWLTRGWGRAGPTGMAMERSVFNLGSRRLKQLMGASLPEKIPAAGLAKLANRRVFGTKPLALPVSGFGTPMMIFGTFWGLRNLFRAGKGAGKGRTLLDPHAETALREIRRLHPHLQKIYFRGFHSIESALTSQPSEKTVLVDLNPRSGRRYASDGTVSHAQLHEGTVHGEFSFRNGAWFLTQESLSYLLNCLDVFRSPSRRTLHLAMLQFADRQEANRILEPRRDRQWGMRTPGGHRTVSTKRGTIRPKLPLPPIGKPIPSFVSWTDREARYGFGDEIEGSLIPVPPDSSFQPIGGRLWQVIHYRYTVQGHLLALVPPDLNLHDSLPEGIPIIQVRLAQGTAAYRWEGGQKVILALMDFSQQGDQKDPAKTLLFFGAR